MVSVCMATHNGEKYIAEQVESILPQLGKNDELVVSDDGSTDTTMEILKNFNDRRIKIFHNNQKERDKYHPFQYVTKNFENALKNASGDYIFLSDQDDVWLPNKIETMQPLLQKDCLVICDSWITDDNLEKQKKTSSFVPYKKGFISNLLYNRTQGCACAFTKKVKDYVLPIPNGIVSHDFWIRLLAELKFGTIYIPEPLFYYRRHANNLSDFQKSKNTIFFRVKYRIVMLWECLKRVGSKK